MRVPRSIQSLDRTFARTACPACNIISERGGGWSQGSARGVKGCAIDRAKHGGTTTPAADTLEV